MTSRDAILDPMTLAQNAVGLVEPPATALSP